MGASESGPSLPTQGPSSPVSSSPQQTHPCQTKYELLSSLRGDFVDMMKNGGEGNV